MKIERPGSLSNMIRLSKSSISFEEKEAVMEVLEREFLGMGAEVLFFEEQLSIFFNRQTTCVVNGTAALHLALQALGIGPGDEVIVPSLTYLSSFQAISATGAKPVACDVSEDTLTMDYLDVEKRITKHSRALMPVHYAGGVGNIDKIYELAEKKNLRVVEDAAHAFGTSFKGNRVGSFGDIACFSFDGIKNITSGEGGCVVTNDQAILDRVMDDRLLGVKKDSEKRYSNQRSWEFDVTSQGWRYHMSNIMAAIGIQQLKKFEEKAEKRQKIAKHYDDLLQDNSRLKRLNLNYDEVVPHIYSLRVLGLAEKEELQKRLLEKNIQTGVHYFPNHLLSLYKNKFQKDLPVTNKIHEELISLPLHPDLSMEEIEYICDTLRMTIDEL